MLWVIWDIVVPVIVAFIAGLGLGWLLWRWRRNNADADQLHAMRREIVRYQTDLRRLQSGDSHSVLQSKTTAVELASANKRIDTLAAELRESREALARQRDLQDVAPARPPVAADTASLTVVERNRLRDVEARLHGAQRRIADLEEEKRRGNSLQSVAPAGSDLNTLQSLLQQRDETIRTLKQSLLQFGDSSDIDSLRVEVLDKDRKINALESLLDQTRQQIH